MQNRDQNTYLLRLYAIHRRTSNTRIRQTKRWNDCLQNLYSEKLKDMSPRDYIPTVKFKKILPRIRHIVSQISTNSVRTCSSDDDLYVIVFFEYAEQFLKSQRKWWTYFKYTKTTTFCIYESRSKRVQENREILYVVIFLDFEINLRSLLTPWCTRRMTIVSRSDVRSTISSHPYLH